MRRMKKVLTNKDAITQQAKYIRDIVQSIMDSCQKNKPLDMYARNKVTGGSLAKDAAVLGIMIVQDELEHDVE